MQTLFLLLLLYMVPNTKHNVTMAAQEPLQIRVQNLKNSEANVWIALYTNNGAFGKSENMYRGAQASPNGQNSVSVNFTNLAYGTYAVAVFQDINGNGKLDTGLFGIPKEPYGFSNNFKPTFSAPTFNNCQFEYNEQSYSIRINIIK